MSSLSDKYVADTFDGLLHSSGEPLPSTGQADIYDGLGNKSALKLGRDGNGTTLTGPVKLGQLEYPTVNGTVGSVIIQDSANTLALKPIETVFTEIVNHIYPVGSIHTSFSNINPATRFIGTLWEQVSQGRFLVGIGSGSDGVTTKTAIAGNNSGEYNHTLTEAEMPSHTHSLINPDNDEQFYLFNDGNFSGGPTGTNRGDGPEDGKDGRYMNYLPSTGGGGSHNNTPPGYGIYVWRRTA
jgi:hypothetical protein